MRSIQRRSLTTLLSLSLSLVILCSLVMHTWLSYQFVQDTEIDFIRERYQTLNQTSATLLQHHWQELAQEVAFLTQKAPQNLKQWSQVTRLFYQHHHNLHQIRLIDLFIVNGSQKIIFSPNLSPSDAKHRTQHIQSALRASTTPYWSSVYLDQTQKPHLYYFYPASGHYTLGLRVTFERVNWLTHEQILVTPMGEAVTSNAYLQQWPRLERVLFEYQNQEKTPLLYEEFLALIRPLQNPDLYLMYFVPIETITAIAQPLLKQLILLSVLSLLILLFIHQQLLSRLLAAPLHQIVKKLNTVQPEQPTMLIETSAFTEFAQIQHAFHRLLSLIRAYQTDLELKIQQRTQELAQAKQRAEEATARKSLHLSAVSHDLRTPLNGILGHLQLLEVEPGLNRKTQRLLQYAKHSSQDLLDIIENLLDFARIERGEIQLNTQPTLLLPLLEKITTTLYPLAHQRHLKLQVIIGSQVPAQIRIDATRMQQILMNLLGNSLKFTNHGGVRLSVYHHLNNIHFFITDTGTGIAKADLARVFEPFEQAGDHQQGSGLGLAISQQLTHHMGGVLKIRSKKDRYSIFHLCFACPSGSVVQDELTKPLKISTALPLEKQLHCWGIEYTHTPPHHLQQPLFLYSPAALLEQLKALQQGHKENVVLPKNTPLPQGLWILKILVVDDIEMNRDVTVQMLKKLGHQTFLAHNGLQALELGKKHIFDLVLLDFRMPHLSGMETCQAWRQAQDILDTDCFIALLTANALVEQPDHNQADEINSYVIKPVDWQKLAHVIEQACVWQHQRGLDLLPNPQYHKPIINVDTPNMQASARQTLTQLKQDLEKAENRAAQQEILHQINGVCGLAGFIDLQREAAACEKTLEDGAPLESKCLKKLLEHLQVAIHNLCENSNKT